MKEEPQKKNTTYLMRDVPRDLWGIAKKRAIDDGTSLRELVLKAVRQYLSATSPGDRLARIAREQLWEYETRYIPLPDEKEEL